MKQWLVAGVSVAGSLAFWAALPVRGPGEGPASLADSPFLRDGKAFRIDRPTDVDGHASSPRSVWLPVAADEIQTWITTAAASDRGAWTRRLRARAGGLPR